MDEKKDLIDRIAEEAKDLLLIIEIAKAYFNGTYRKIPVKSIVAIVGTLLYVFLPSDFIPDFLPAIGISDDIVAIGICLKLIGDDIDTYKAWKESQTNNEAA